MRDFPFFTTEFGVSSLVLREIPYREEAYIRILEVQPGMEEAHLSQCVAFCRMAGAESVYGTGTGTEVYPEFMSVLEMGGMALADPGKTASLFPVTEKTASRWRELYNNAMRAVDNAGTLEKRDEKRLLERAGAYFVHDGGELLGIGWVDDRKLLAVASVKKGAGERVMHTLMSLAEGERMTLEVASTNGRAISLYERMGFLKTRIVETWYVCHGAELTVK